MKPLRFFYSSIPLLLFFSQSLLAQNNITGRVTDGNDGTPLIGVTIALKGASAGTTTDLDGAYSLKADPQTAVLVFSYVGYATKEIAADGRTNINVILGEADNLLDQVVVVGYGTMKKSDLTGAVGNVKSKDLQRIATASIDQALQGKIAGVHVTPESGEPGRGAVIRIRGTGTLNNANPVYVIDGMITYDASFVNPQDVESVEVLKDASACAIYGSRGANGVIIITTKNGKKRENAAISFSAYTGMQQTGKRIEMANATEFATLYNEFRGSNYFPNPAAFGVGTDWQSVIFRDAPISNVQLGMNGGTDRYTYNVSANLFDQAGVVKESDFQRVTVRFNNEIKMNSWLKLGNNLAFSKVKKQIGSGVVGSALQMPPLYAERDSTGKFSDPTFFGLAIGNPAASLEYGKNHFQDEKRFFGSIYGEVSFLKYFTFRSNFGFDLNNEKEKSYTPVYAVSASQVNKDDRLAYRLSERKDWIWEQTLTFNRDWEKHHLNVLAGYTAEERSDEAIRAGRRNYPGTTEELLYLDAGNDTTQTNAGSASDEALLSYLFRTNYTFNDRYLLTVSMRIDESSRFTSANRRGIFPSASVGWNLGQEDFIENLRIFDRLKVRLSYGILGNQASASRYPGYGNVQNGLGAIFGPNESLNSGATLTALGNPSLRWETVRQTDAGLEFGLLDGRLTGELDWYERYTYDIIARVPIPKYIGSQEDPFVNTAKVRNQGWDITLNWRQAGKFSWNIGALLSPVKNELIELNSLKSEQFSAFLQGEPASRSAAGLPIGAFYGYKVAGVFQNAEDLAKYPRFGNEAAGDLRFEDTNGDGVMNGQDRSYLGSPIPTLTYGFSAGFDWQGLDFAADLIGSQGNKIYNAKSTFRFGVYNWEKQFVERWTGEGTSNTRPRTTNGGPNYRVSDFFLEDGRFLRLRSVILGYSLPQNWLQKVKINKFRVYVSGNNLWTKQTFSGYSPELPNRDNPYEVGFDFGAYPITKSYQVGVDVTF